MMCNVYVNNTMIRLGNITVAIGSALTLALKDRVFPDLFNKFRELSQNTSCIYLLIQTEET